MFIIVNFSTTVTSPVGTHTWMLVFKQIMNYNKLKYIIQ